MASEAREQLGEGQLETAEYIYTLGKLNRIIGRYQMAATLFQEVLEAREKQLGDGHIEYANVSRSLGRVYLITGQYEAAKPLLRKAARIRRKELGKFHPGYVASLTDLAELYLVTGRDVKYYLKLWKVGRIIKKYGTLPPNISGNMFLGSDLDLNNDDVSELVASMASLSRKMEATDSENCSCGFPWPPPKQSAFYPLPGAFFEASQTLGDVEKVLIKALDACGYSERRFYCIFPDMDFSGFALVARIEQIDEDGQALPPPDRWSVKMKKADFFSLDNFIKVIFSRNSAYFRVIVFLVTNRPPGKQREIMSMEEGMGLLSGGSFVLSSNIRDIPFSGDYNCTALIYEFEAPESRGKPGLKDPSEHTGDVHLEKSGLLKALSSEK